MPGLVASRLTAVVDADTADAEKGLSRVNRAVENTASTGRRLGGVATGLTAGITLPMVGAGLAAGKMAMDYEQTMDVLRASLPPMDRNAATMARMSQRATQLGADITLPGTSAKDAGDAMLQFARAGLSANDSMEGARGALQLAAAGQIEVADAATLTGNALQVFGLRGGEATRVADLLAAGASATSAEVGDMALGLQRAGSSFATAKMPVDALVTSISLMAKQGISGSDAGTSLATMLNRLMAPTARSAKRMKELGINVRDSHGELLQMPQLVDLFTSKMGKMTPAARDAAMMTIFGTDAIRAARNVLLTGGDAYSDMAGKVNEVGAAQRLSEAYNRGAKGALDALKSTVETAAIAFATSFLPTIRRVALGLAALISWLTNLPAPIKAMMGALAGVAAAAGPILGVVAAFSKLRGVIAALKLAPLLAGFGIFGVLAAVVAGFYVAYKTNFLGIRDITLQVVAAARRAWDQFVAGFQGGSIGAAMGQTVSVFERLGSIVRTVVNGARTAWQAFVAGFSGGPLHGTISGLQAAFQAFGSGVRVVWNYLVAGFRTVVAFFLTEGAKWVAWFHSIAPVAVAAFRNVVSFIRVQIGVLVAVVSVGLRVLLALWRGAWPGILTVLRGVWQVISSVVSGAMSIIRGVIQVIMSVIAGNWGQAWNGIKMIASGVWRAIGGIIQGGLKILVGLFQAIGGALLNLWRAAWSRIDAATQRFMARVRGAVSRGFQAVVSAIAGALGRAVARVVAAWNRADQSTQRMMAAIRSAVTRAFSAVVSAIAGALGRAVSAVVNGWNRANAATQRMMAAVRAAVVRGFTAVVSAITSALARAVSAVSSGVSRIISWFSGLPSRIVGALGNLGGLLSGAGRQVIDGFIGGITGAFDRVRSTLSNLTGMLPDWKGPRQRDKKILTPAGRAVMLGFLEGLLKVAPTVMTTLQAITRRIRMAGQDSLNASLRDENKRMAQLVNQRKTTIARLKAANKQLTDVRKQAADYTKSVRDQVVGTGNVTQFIDPATHQGDIVARMRDAVTQARNFANAISRLRKQGLNKTSLDQLVQAGPEQGLATARNILNRGSVRQINTLQKQLRTYGTRVGKIGADSMYGAGVQAARGLVHGLMAKEDAITAAMKRLAQRIVVTVKRALRIHSPSAVMADVGKMISLGVVKGVRGQQGLVDSTIGNLVSPRTGRVGVTVGRSVDDEPRFSTRTRDGGIDYDKLARAMARIQVNLDGRVVAKSVDERLGMVIL